MVHDKILYHHCIIQDLCDPIVLCISYDISLRVLSHTNILKSKIKSVHYTWNPKDVRILALDNSNRTLACKSIIGDNLDDILRSNLFDAIFKLGCNEFLVLFSPSTFTEFKNIMLLLVTAMKLMMGLLCASAHPSLQMDTPSLSKCH